MMKACVETVPGACGVANVYDFAGYYGKEIDKDTPLLYGGAGYLFASFVEGAPYCIEMFNMLSARYPLIFRSETRLNVNSNHQFYFCIFDGKESGEPIGWAAIDNAEDEEDF